ncbi:MAG: AI-2E family transporter, partial [Clostridia bacterium]|nr:AI-2E family transporter [Clostridia bacterium]
MFVNSFDLTQLQTYAKGVVSFTSGFFSGFVAFIASIYMLLDKARLQALFIRILNSFFKEKTVAAITEHAKRMNEVFTNYIYSRLSCSIIMAVICSVVLSIMGVKYALILGVFIGAMDMIPYFGSIISSVIAIIITFITGGFWLGVWTAVALLVLQQFDGNILGPKIMGDSLEIRPFWIIFAISVGGSLFGFVGMLISVPIFAIIRIVISDYISTRERRIKDAEQASEETNNADK